MFWKTTPPVWFKEDPLNFVLIRRTRICLFTFDPTRFNTCRNHWRCWMDTGFTHWQSLSGWPDLEKGLSNDSGKSWLLYRNISSLLVRKLKIIIFSLKIPSFFYSKITRIISLINSIINFAMLKKKRRLKKKNLWGMIYMCILFFF